MKSRLAVLMACITFSSIRPIPASGSWPLLPSEQVRARRSTPEVRDEADPKDTRSCYEMGQLQITYQSQDGEPPKLGVLVTDPRSRRIGYDPAGPNAWQELPLAQAFIDCAEQDANGQLRACRGWIQICGPLSGTYKLEVVASENSKYSLDISAVSRQKHDGTGFHSTESHTALRDASIQERSRETLLLEYSREPGSKIALRRSEETPVALKK